jgi:hypothetical protein
MVSTLPPFHWASYPWVVVIVFIINDITLLLVIYKKLR